MSSVVPAFQAARRSARVCAPAKVEPGNARSEQDCDAPDGCLGPAPPVDKSATDATSLREMTKRAFDLVVSTVAIVFLSPLMLVIACRLALEGGPVLFVQTRVGHNRSRFSCLKFRTMHVDGEARLAAVLATSAAARLDWAVHQKLQDDPRTTAFGRALRSTSLDELPQLFNVLRGDMSLVGPRPIIAPEVPGYPRDRAYYDSDSLAAYASCRPGLTGLWQIAGRHRTSHAARTRFDQRYARTRSLGLDLRILLRTIPVVIGCAGA